MKLCRHSFAADGSDRISDKALSRYRHGTKFVGSIAFVPHCKERERSQGGILAGGDFRPLFGRKYNRLPLDAVTRNTLLQWKGNSFPFLPPGEGGFGRSPLQSLGRGMPERRGCPF